MKRTKKALNLLVAACVAFALAACGGNGDGNSEQTDGTGAEGAKETTEEEKNSEDGNDDGDSEDIEVDVGKGMKWPKESMGDLPEPGVVVTAIIRDESSGQCVVTFAEMTAEGAAGYIQKLKDVGFSSGMEMVGEDSMLYSGTKSDGNVTFAYYTEGGGGTISYGPVEAGAVEDENDMTDAAPWPSELMGGAPELEGKITDITNDNDRYITVYLKAVEKSAFEAYLEEIAAAGFVVDKNKSSSLDNIDYRAYNDSGDWIRARLRISDDGNMATVEFEKSGE